MRRRIDKYLLKWKEAKTRKALLLRGARQVGKTYSIRQLAKSFKHYLEVNFEEEKSVKQFFSRSLNPSIICQKLSAYFGKKIVPGETLLFFDEIQACPEALSSLRFFYEKIPDLHVAAAGSLLEFALTEIPSQGVGRIYSLFMYPMSFDEFLLAMGEDSLMNIKNNAGLDKQLDEAFHTKLIDYLKIFFIIGGMPESIKQFVKSKDLLISQKNLSGLIETLQDDFAKYKRRSPVQRLREVFDSITFQSGSKFKYSNIDSASAHRYLKEALSLIAQAGLAYKIYHSSARGIPLGAQIKINKFKVILFDVAIHQKILGLDIADIITAKNTELINKGDIAEIFVGTEIIKYFPLDIRPQLYYWHKEKRGSNAEVDYLIQKGEKIIPLEVKSGSRGQMQSMRIFMNERSCPYGIKISLENFQRKDNIHIYPLYAVANLMRERIHDI